MEEVCCRADAPPVSPQFAAAVVKSCITASQTLDICQQKLFMQLNTWCVQNSAKAKATNMKARAFNASEYAMMLEYTALPEFQFRSLAMRLGDYGSWEEWDKKSKEYFALMEAPRGLTYHSVHWTFGLSQDHATIHKRIAQSLLTPRVTPLQEYTAIYDAAKTQLNVDVTKPELRSQAFDTVMQRLTSEKSATTDAHEKHRLTLKIRQLNRMRDRMSKMSAIELLVNVKFKKGPSGQQDLAEEIHDLMLAEYTSAANQNEHAPWEAVFRRKQAFYDVRWRCFLPEQLMTLGDTTPDLHQSAEMLVGIYKRAMKNWLLEQDPEAPETLAAKHYAEAMQKRCRERNVGRHTGTAEDQRAITGSIRRLWITSQIVAAPYGQVFTPQLPPGSSEDGGHATEFAAANFTVKGSGGQFPEAKWS